MICKFIKMCRFSVSKTLANCSGLARAMVQEWMVLVWFVMLLCDSFIRWEAGCLLDLPPFCHPNEDL